MIVELKGQAALITGASQGLGLTIARAYVSAGADVLICGRTPVDLEQARGVLASESSPGQVIAARVTDVSKPCEVEALVAQALSLFPRLHILVNNAGVYGPKGVIEDVDWAEWVRAVEINLLGSVLMCRAVLPHFKKHRQGKILQLSGGGATNPLPCLSAYAASKAAVVRFVETLAEEVKEYGIDVNAIAPGALNTRLLDEVLEAGPAKVGEALYRRSVEQKQLGGTPVDRGAELAVFLGSEASNGITGKLISAVWDPWKSLEDHLGDLTSSDVYTLRRILPKDRGMAWGDLA